MRRRAGVVQELQCCKRVQMAKPVRQRERPQRRCTDCAQIVPAVQEVVDVARPSFCAGMAPLHRADDVAGSKRLGAEARSCLCLFWVQRLAQGCTRFVVWGRGVDRATTGSWGLGVQRRSMSSLRLFLL